MAKIVIAGGTGNLGQKLTQAFLDRGDQVLILSRQDKPSDHPNLQFMKWDGEQLDSWCQHLEKSSVLINLSGLSINRIFNKKNQALLRNSRIIPTTLLGRAIQQLANPPKLWINASGISVFNNQPGMHDESSKSYSSDFLATLGKDWEAACLQTETPETQKVILRISPILSRTAGMFKELYPLAKIGLAGTVGSGKQTVSWMHEQDFVHLVLWIVDQEQPDTIYHACSPNPVSNAEWMHSLRKAVGCPIGLPLPSLLAKLGAYVQGIDPSLLLDSVPVTTLLASKAGFTYKFPYLQPALNQLVNQST